MFSQAMWFGGVHLSIPIILPQNHSCGGLPCIMAFNVPYLSLFFELVFLLFFVGTVCSFFFFFFL